MTPIDPVFGEKLSWFAFSFIILCHSSQYPLMWTMLKDKDPSSLSKYSIIPTLAQAATCSMWIGYAYCVLPTIPLLLNNSIGVFNSFVYLCVFLLKRPTFGEKLFAGTSFVLLCSSTVLIYGLLYREAYDKRNMVASALTTIVTVALWASPLVGLKLALQDLDEKHVPIPLTICMTIACAGWLSVGFYVGDITLTICSAIGVFFCCLQLYVISIIHWKKRSPSMPKDESNEANNGVTILSTA